MRRVIKKPDTQHVNRIGHEIATSSIWLVNWITSTKRSNSDSSVIFSIELLKLSIFLWPLEVYQHLKRKNGKLFEQTQTFIPTKSKNIMIIVSRWDHVPVYSLFRSSHLPSSSMLFLIICRGSIGYLKTCKRWYKYWILKFNKDKRFRSIISFIILLKNYTHQVVRRRQQPHGTAALMKMKWNLIWNL